MSILPQLASALGSRDDKPNQALARQLAASKDVAAIAELAQHLANPNPAIASDCIKTLYEIGYIDPALIAPYWQKFLALLKSRHNRMVWGGLIALATIAPLVHADLVPHVPQLIKIAKTGSVIAVDSAIKALGVIAAKQPGVNAEICAYLLEHLKTCRPKEVAQHAESTLVAVKEEYRAAFSEALQARLADVNPSAARRVKKVISQLTL